MKMQVMHGLPRVGAIVRNYPVATIEQSSIASNLSSQCQGIACDFPVARTNLAQGRQVFAGNDKNVDRCLRRKVAKRDIVVTLGDKLGSEFPSGNSAEYAVI
jgi:hypothetical protein